MPQQVAVHHQPFLQSTTDEIDTPLFNNSTYNAWVRAHYADGTKSNWGSPLVFETGVPSADPFDPINFTAGLDDASDATPELA